MEYADKIEQLNTRIDNLKVVIQVAEMEIAILLEEIDKIQNPKQIGFIISSSSNGKDKSKPNKHPPSNS